MATSARKSRPGVVLTIFLLVIVLLYGIMALSKTWYPKLGLDLQGGMTITLTATNDEVTPESMELAQSIIQQRVDGLGVGEASVTVSGERNIIVSAPNIQRDDLVELVGSTAQLTFRPVLSVGAVEVEEGPGLPTAPPEAPEETGENELLSVTDAVNYQPTEEEQIAYAEYECGDPAPESLDTATFACDETGTQKYLLGPVAIEGESVTNASSGIPQNELNYVVALEFDDEGTDRLAELTTQISVLTSPNNMFAVVLDGQIESAATVDEVIPGGQAQISGNFTAETAASLAQVLRFGSLPLNFDTSQVESVSPTLGGEQLRWGLIAGLAGLLIVLLYCFVYYRGLGIVVVGSLTVAAFGTYAVLALLGETVGVAVNLPAIAGAVVSIGLTADSFVIYFERIRDEIREGRSLRSAIDTGWVKARSTIIVADLVSLLSAVVLFLLAEGGVQGFAFMLGLTTLIDLAICFFFTKPLVSLLGRTKFFGEGHRFSGLDASHMGVSRDALLGRRWRRSGPVRKEA